MENQRLEYDLIQRVRMDWTGNMMLWRNIAIPLSLTIIGIVTGLNSQLWVIGWLLGIFLLIFWRFMERHIDKQIQGLYPRIVTLEEQLGMTFYSHYLWLNLEKKQNVPQFQNGNFNYQGVINNLIHIGRRGHDINMAFLTVYYILGVGAFYTLLCLGFYSLPSWLIGLAIAITVILLVGIIYLWIPQRIRREDM